MTSFQKALCGKGKKEELYSGETWQAPPLADDQGQHQHWQTSHIDSMYVWYDVMKIVLYLHLKTHNPRLIIMRDRLQILDQSSSKLSRSSNQNQGKSEILSESLSQAILKKISPEYSWEGLMLKLKLQYFGHLMQRTDSLEKTLMLGKIKARGEGDDSGWEGWMASPTQWTWVCVSSVSWWWTGKPGVLQSRGSQRVILSDWTDWCHRKKT